MSDRGPRKAGARADEKGRRRARVEDDSEVKATPESAERAPESTPIVGLGASAGGLDAFLRIVRHLPPDAGLAYVMVQHLAPDHESLLPELLSRAATIPVAQAEDGMRIAPDHAYVIPPNTTMTISDGHLRLVPRTKQRAPHLTVDAFLASLAEVHGSAAIGVILSGAGTDGARGIQAIKEAGGLTFAQESSSSQFPSMPAAAIDTGAVDFVLTPEEIAEQLGRLGRHLSRNDASEEEQDAERGESALRQILRLLLKRTGVDFQQYRRGTVHRRVLRRMLVHRRDTRSEYLAHVRLDPGELDLLYDDLLIAVTSFFRDPEVFVALRETAFPTLLDTRPPDTPIRVWVAGCAGGEEAYSIAIALLECLDSVGQRVPIQLFGTDLSDTAIARARIGWYPRTIEEQVSPERLRRFFVAEDGGYRIAKAVRELCVFSRQNIVRDPPFSHLDLVSCRNVLIYLEPTLQRRVFPIFHYALEHHGLLLLGSAESPGSASELFTPLVKRRKIYRRRATAVRSLEIDFSVPVTPMSGTSSSVHSWRRGVLAAPERTASADEVATEGDRLVLTRFAPPGVIVDELGEVRHFRGNTALYLTHTSGVASLDLIGMARPELVMAIRAALSRAAVSGEPSRESHVAMLDAERRREVAIEVIPFRPAGTPAQFFSVSFVEEANDPLAILPGDGAELDIDGGSGARSRRRRVVAADDGRELTRTREELAVTRRYLQDVIEQHGAATEELRAASEEIQSSNEELQSTNEELETTKEEVQSANEELTTLNEELLHRNRELGALSADLSNILSSTTIPIAIVGSDLRLRRFTPALDRVMRVIATDSGRPLDDVRLRFEMKDFEKLVTSTIETLAVNEREVRDDDGCWWSLTIRPYQTVDRRVDGAVLVFSNIDAVKHASELAEEASAERGRLLALSEEARGMAEEARGVAETANQTKGVFLANISHDLRTPLNAITGYADLLEIGVRGPVTEMQRADLVRIKVNARHLLALINDILNFAKVDAGHLTLFIENLPLADILASLEGLVAPQLAAKQLRLEVRDAVGGAKGDRERVGQVLVNLLSNAIKFTASGGRITVWAEEKGDVATITVSDTGRGIPADHLERIFEPFVQVARGLTTPPPDGVGLGLAISRHLALAMRGDLTVTSTVGEGSTFVLTLPRAES